MKKSEKIWLFAAVTLPLVLFISLWQVFRFEQMKRDLSVLDDQQNEWFEQNRRLVSSISVYSSPERISRIAENDLKLSKDEQRNIIRIVIKE